MLAIAQQLEDREIEVEITGGGTGEKFLELNDRETYSPSTIHYTSKYYEEGLFSALKHLATSLRSRVSDLKAWLRDQDPDVVITDDPLVPFICMYEGLDYYIVSHWSWKMPENRLEKTVTWTVNKISTLKVSRFLYPAVWEDLEPRKADKIGPVAPEGLEKELDFDVLVVPTKMKDRTDEFVDELEEYDLEVVGSDNWELQPSLQPYIEEADVVICGGYSTVMEASVAGTSCVIVPYTSEQEGIANILDGYRGYRKYTGDIREDISQVEVLEPRENGAEDVAEFVSGDLENKG
jgi:UDP-N-acetylglucosamine:LPS N-acetylglucosamine transferase